CLTISDNAPLIPLTPWPPLPLRSEGELAGDVPPSCSPPPSVGEGMGERGNYHVSTLNSWSFRGYSTRVPPRRCETCSARQYSMARAAWRSLQAGSPPCSTHETRSSS